MARGFLNVSIIQANLYWQQPQANLDMFAQKIASLPTTELVVLPEMFNSGFTMQPTLYAETMEGPTVAWMRKMAQQHKIVLAGTLAISEAGLFYNRFVWMLPNGILHFYDKRHLFAYAGENEHYQPGNKRVVVQLNGFKILLQVCYDLRFPVFSRQQTQEGNAEYDLILYVANWPQSRSLAWRTLLRARAIENQCYVIGVNRVGMDGNEIEHSGDSAMIDPMGEVIFESRNAETQFTHCFQLADLLEIRQRLPFLKDADSFVLEK